MGCRKKNVRVQEEITGTVTAAEEASP